ncbi:MAG: 2-oxoacid:acceptor oxidoreductase family protein [Lachnospirales bacterium]
MSGKQDTYKLTFSGFGGQGVLTIGLLLAEVAMNKGYNVTWIPSYGAEMRGGTANCKVIISNKSIGSPFVKEMDYLIAMNYPSFVKFEELVKADGKILSNASLNKGIETTKNVIDVEATDIAAELGNLKVQNIVILGALFKELGLFDITDAKEIFEKKFTGDKAKLIELNLEAFKRGYGA